MRTDLTLLATRALVGAIFLWHGVPKAIDPAMAMEKFAAFGLPGLLGPVVGVVEVIAAVLLVAGVVFRPAGVALAAIIAGALVTVQIPAGVTAGLERDLLILVALVLLVAQGPGRWTVTAVLGSGRRREAAPAGSLP